MKQIIEQYPKVELHTHLNGCIREHTLNSWHSNSNVTDLIDSFLSPETNGKIALSKCFTAFDLIYEATSTLDRIKILAKEVLEDYDKDNTLIAEIRTTPRRLEGLTQRDYINAIIQATEEYLEERKATKTTPFYPYFLLSINRSRLNDAKETIELASEYKKKTEFIRGIELSGNPFKGHYSEIVSLMQYARELGLSFTMHIGEKNDDEEALKLIECLPSRVGHGIYLNEEHIQLMKQNKIGCEICLTSNMVSRSIPEYSKHPMMQKERFDGKVFVSCDDRGLFRTSMNDELTHAIEHYCNNDIEKGKKFLKQLCVDGIEYSFLDDEKKALALKYVESL